MAIFFTIACCLLVTAVVVIGYLYDQVARLSRGGAEVVLAHEIVAMKREREAEREQAKDRLVRVMIERFPLFSRFSQPLDYSIWDCELRSLVHSGLDLNTDNPRFRDLLEQVKEDAAQIDGKGRSEQAHCKECLAYLEGIWQTNELEANTAEAPAPSRRAARL